MSDLDEVLSDKVNLEDVDDIEVDDTEVDDDDDDVVDVDQVVDDGDVDDDEGDDDEGDDDEGDDDDEEDDNKDNVVSEVDGINMYDDDDNYNDDDDDDYLKKFNNNVFDDYIQRCHPETKNHNIDEVLGMTKIIRDDNGDIVDNNHKTIPILTKYEKSRILGIRAKQIDEGSNIFTEISNKIVDGYTIAVKEFNEKKIPFILKRPLPNGTCEYWNIKDLEII
jgi:DNA-directed RNA polymerase subunit K/omega